MPIGSQASFLNTNYRDQTGWETGSSSSGAGGNHGETRKVHATLQKTLAKAGHNETHASAPGAGPVYLAPYVAFKEERAGVC